MGSVTASASWFAGQVDEIGREQWDKDSCEKI